ncbi:SDR family NAD(P)-dependent oxidoreductase, partial [Acinetobacter baumannii]
IALITGGSRGLGKNAALHLAREGVGILLTYVGNRTAAEATVSEIEALGVPAVALQLDLADSASVPAFAQQVSDALYRVWQVRQFN